MIPDNSYRSYERLLNADNFVLKMKKCPDTVTMRLLKANMFSLGEEQYMLRNPCRVCQVPVETLFCSNSNTDGFIITISRIAKWSWFLTWPSWDLSKWKSCKSRLFNTHYHGLGYNCIHLILLSKSTDTAILAVQAFKISCSDFKKMTYYKISQFGIKKNPNSV